MRKLLNVIIAVGTLVLAFAVSTNTWVIWQTDQHIYTSAAQVPPTRVGLVLGTSKRNADGGENLFFTARMRAAAALYKAGRVQHLILSGDNKTRYYNEPKDMMKALVALGVSANDITLDYAGFRTLDSVVRSKEVFGQKEIVIITQKFHAYRAIFIAEFYGIKASCYVANDAEKSRMASVVNREWLARPRAVLDLYLLQESPKFLGEKEIIEIRKKSNDFFN